MRRTLVLIACAAALTACGGGGGAATDSAANNEACALIADAAAIFGEGADIVGNSGDAPIAADCQFTSADGTRSGEVLIFTPASLGAVTAETQLTTLSEGWDGATETALEPLQLGDGGVLAKDLPGYQTQIAFRSGASVVAILGSSGDARMSGEQIARALADAAVAAPPP